MIYNTESDAQQHYSIENLAAMSSRQAFCELNAFTLLLLQIQRQSLHTVDFAHDRMIYGHLPKACLPLRHALLRQVIHGRMCQTLRAIVGIVLARSTLALPAAAINTLCLPGRARQRSCVVLQVDCRAVEDSAFHE